MLAMALAVHSAMRASVQDACGTRSEGCRPCPPLWLHQWGTNLPFRPAIHAMSIKAIIYHSNTISKAACAGSSYFAATPRREWHSSIASGTVLRCVGIIFTVVTSSVSSYLYLVLIYMFVTPGDMASLPHSARLPFSSYAKVGFLCICIHKLVTNDT
jgi:hypothetical protein